MNWRDKIHNTLYSNKREEWAIEGEFQVALSIAIIKKLDVYIYGAGEDIWSAIGFFKHQGIEVCAVIDKDTRKKGCVIHGVKVIDCDTFMAENQRNSFVFIWTYCINFRNIEIMNILHRAGVKYYYIIKPQERYLLNAIQYELAWLDANRPSYYIEHEEEIINFANILQDDISRETLTEYLRAYMEGGYYRGENLPTKYKYLFDRDGNAIYTHLSDEVWINCGANYGDNIFLFFRNGLTCKNIYAVEADKKIAETLKENIVLLPSEEAGKISVINKCIDENTEWDFLEDNKVTLVNADIEGAELALIKSLKEIIIKDRPVLSICMYHKKEDIVDIPKYLMSTVQNYKYYLRKYASYQGNYQGNYELVLYCVPEERSEGKD